MNPLEGKHGARGSEAGADVEGRLLRHEMVQRQLVARGICDPQVLDAFRRVPRHRFCLPGTPLRTAYGDFPLDIGHGQTISQPLMVAEMTARLQLQPQDRVLEIGTGSGYQAALLAVLVREVHSIERIPALAEAAAARLRECGYENVRVHVGDGSCGWREAAPYAAIVVAAAAPEIPESLQEQLADGGRLAIPVGPRHTQNLVICRRRGDCFDVQQTGGCRFVPLIGRHAWPD